MFSLSCEFKNYFITDPVIPWYYYVPREGIENERNEPNSVRRLPASKYLTNNTLYLYIGT